MATAKLTLIDLQRYMQYENDDLFSLMVLPDDVDKDTLTGNILLRGGEFEVMYADPSFLKLAIELWSKKWYRTFDKWVKALAIEYSPLENYDRFEDYTDTEDRNRDASGQTDSGNVRTFDNQDKETIDTEDKRTLDTKSTVISDVSAFDSSDYQPSTKTVTTEEGTDTLKHTGTDTNDHSGTIKDDYGETSSSNEKEDKTFIHKGRIHGNIGVTTSQQMLESELSLAEWNLYEHMTDLFLSEFVIPIYS